MHEEILQHRSSLARLCSLCASSLRANARPFPNSLKKKIQVQNISYVLVEHLLVVLVLRDRPHEAALEHLLAVDLLLDSAARDHRRHRDVGGSLRAIGSYRLEENQARNTEHEVAKGVHQLQKGETAL